MSEATSSIGSLTPRHSIPNAINTLKISGSQGRFATNDFYPPSSSDIPPKPSNPPTSKSPPKHSYSASSNSPLKHFYPPSSDSPLKLYFQCTSDSPPKPPDQQQRRFDQLYQDAAKRSAIKEKLASYASLQKEKAAEVFKSDKKLTKAESSELFERLNREAAARTERAKISQRIKEEQESKLLKNPSVNKSCVFFKQDVVSRLLLFGECAKLKNEAKVRRKTEIEDEEFRNMPSVHKRYNSDITLSSNMSTPGKEITQLQSKAPALTTKPSFSPEKLAKITEPVRSLNSPDKIIQKFKTLAGNAAPSSVNSQKIRPIKPRK